jgi:hypothetical protein
MPLNISFVNVQSLGLSAPTSFKLSDLHSRMYAGDYDVFGMVETWLPKRKEFADLHAVGYELFRCDRGEKSNDGGGAALYAKLKHNPVLLDKFDKCGLEIVVVELSLGKKDKQTVILLYNPPSKRASLCDGLERFLSQMSKRRLSNCVLIGDFNVDWLKDSAQQKKLSNLTSSFGLRQVVDQPTHEKSCIDLVFISDATVFHEIELRPPVNNLKHAEVFSRIEVSVHSTAYRTRPIAEYFNYRDANYDEINSRFMEESFVNAFRRPEVDLEVAYAEWSMRLRSVIQDCVKRSRSRNPRFAPWFTRELRAAIGERDSAFKQWKKSRNPCDRSKYEKLRKNFRKSIAKAKREHIEKSFESIESESGFWKNVNRMFGKQNAGLPGLQKEDGTIATEPREKAALLSARVSGNWNHSDGEPFDCHRLPIDAEDCRPFLCTAEDVERYIARLPNETSPGPDGIPSVFIKSTASTIAPVLCDLFNRCILDGTWPSALLESDVLPIFKKGQRSDALNYRPISLLPLFSKLFERHLQSHLTPLIESKLSSMQWAFRAKRSTTSLLIFVKHWILLHLDRDPNHRVEAVFFDLQKAFDQVPWNDLCRCLSDRYNVPAPILRIIASWLHGGRRQRVRVDGEFSEWTDVVSGVPQGSILGPILFSAFIDVVADVRLSPNASIQMFADDILYLKMVDRRSPADVVDVQSDVDAICSAIESTHLSINPKKTEQMTFSLSHLPSPSAVISIGGFPLTPVREIRYLGVVLTPDLSSLKHVEDISKKARQALGCVFRNMHKYASQKTKRKIFTAVIRPRLEYACQAWHAPNERTAAAILESVQRFGAKICTNRWNRGDPDLLAKAQLPLLETRRKQLCLRQMHNFYTGAHFRLDGIIAPTMAAGGLRRSTRLNNAHSLLLDGQLFDRRELAFRTVTFQNSFFPSTIAVWNEHVASMMTTLPNGTPVFAAALGTRQFVRFVWANFS